LQILSFQDFTCLCCCLYCNGRYVLIAITSVVTQLLFQLQFVMAYGTSLLFQL
jgi:hypothetical protein